MSPRDDDVTPPPITPRRVVAGILIAVGIIVPLVVTSYTNDGPRLGGWPFFYWYQMLLVSVTAALTTIAYVLMRQDDKQRKARARATDEDNRS